MYHRYYLIAVCTTYCNIQLYDIFTLFDKEKNVLTDIKRIKILNI